ncbi:MAG: hypothetical protein ACRC5M_06515, partial [Anaeroplasmataceae bacterium]
MLKKLFIWLFIFVSSFHLSYASIFDSIKNKINLTSQSKETEQDLLSKLENDVKEKFKTEVVIQGMHQEVFYTDLTPLLLEAIILNEYMVEKSEIRLVEL